jgi:hypothetical protein
VNEWEGQDRRSRAGLAESTGRGSREPSTGRPGDGQEIVVSDPANGQPVSFERDVKPLFRPSDRQSMTFAFDLWDVADVRANAEDILERLQDGSMPCDTTWSPGQIELFGRWIASGAAD